MPLHEKYDTTSEIVVAQKNLKIATDQLSIGRNHRRQGETLVFSTGMRSAQFQLRKATGQGVQLPQETNFKGGRIVGGRTYTLKKTQKTHFF